MRIEQLPESRMARATLRAPDRSRPPARDLRCSDRMNRDESRPCVARLANSRRCNTPRGTSRSARPRKKGMVGAPRFERGTS